MKKTNLNTEVAALKNTIKQKDEALAELAHDNLELGRRLQLRRNALEELRERGRVAELALGGVKQLREELAQTQGRCKRLDLELDRVFAVRQNLNTQLEDQKATARWYKLAFRVVVLGNLLTAAAICFKFGL